MREDEILRVWEWGGGAEKDVLKGILTNVQSMRGDRVQTKQGDSKSMRAEGFWDEEPTSGGRSRELDEAPPFRCVFLIPQVDEIGKRREPRLYRSAPVSALHRGHSRLL